MLRKKKLTVLMGGEEIRTIHHLTAKERHDTYTRLSHYLLSISVRRIGLISTSMTG